MQPTVILTRPAAQAARFADALKEAGVEVPILLAPLMDIVPVAPDMRFDDVAHIILTSANGVDQAARLALPASVVAWCVGTQTARAAQALGFDVRNARGTSKELIALIKNASPTGKMVHLRGAHARGEIAKTLRAAGCDVVDCITYEQVRLPPSEALRATLGRIDSCVVPLFSPRSARIFAEITPRQAALHHVAISEATLQATAKGPMDKVFLAPQPDQSGMIFGILTAINHISPTITP